MIIPISYIMINTDSKENRFKTVHNQILELTTIPFVSIYYTIELSFHIGKIGSDTWLSFSTYIHLFLNRFCFLHLLFLVINSEVRPVCLDDDTERYS